MILSQTVEIFILWTSCRCSAKLKNVDPFKALLLSAFFPKNVCPLFLCKKKKKSKEAPCKQLYEEHKFSGQHVHPQGTQTTLLISIQLASIPWKQNDRCRYRSLLRSLKKPPIHITEVYKSGLYAGPVPVQPGSHWKPEVQYGKALRTAWPSRVQPAMFYYVLLWSKNVGLHVLGWPTPLYCCMH